MCNTSSSTGHGTFIFEDADAGLDERWHEGGLPSKAGLHNRQTIQVPFAFQAPASGIGDKGAHEVLWYERRGVGDLRTERRTHALLLRFGAVDYEATVWLNGIHVGYHRGGHVPFDVDLSPALAQDGDVQGEEFRITVRVRDSPSDLTQPRGKQHWKPVSQEIF